MSLGVVCMYMYQYVHLGHTQLLLYKSDAVVVAMGFTRTHKSTVVAVVAAVDITRTRISVVVVITTVEIYRDAQIRWACYVTFGAY